jgi:hypothetical protein
MLGGIIEVAAGTAMILYPDPVTTLTGIGLVADGVRRIADDIN